MHLKIFTFLILLISIAACASKSTFPSVTSNSELVSLGMPGDTVYELSEQTWLIFQSRNGDYWFGSKDLGLYKDDGRILINYSTKHGLPSNSIRGFQEDMDGNLFIITMEGISIFDGHSFVTLPVVESNNWNSSPNDSWFSILGKDNVRGPYRYDGKTLYHLKLPKSSLEDAYFANSPNLSYSPYDVYSIYKDSKGHIWFGTSNFGVCRFDGSKHDWLYEDHWTITPEVGSFGIRAMIEDKEGKYWFCTTSFRYVLNSSKQGDGLLSVKQENGISSIKTIKGNDHIYFMSAVKDDEGNMWLATYTEGVWMYDGEKATQFTVDGNAHESFVSSIYKDRQGVLWLGTQESGLFKFNGKCFEHFKLDRI